MLIKCRAHFLQPALHTIMAENQMCHHDHTQSTLRPAMATSESRRLLHSQPTQSASVNLAVLFQMKLPRGEGRRKESIGAGQKQSRQRSLANCRKISSQEGIGNEAPSRTMGEKKANLQCKYRQTVTKHKRQQGTKHSTANQVEKQRNEEKRKREKASALKPRRQSE